MNPKPVKKKSVRKPIRRISKVLSKRLKVYGIVVWQWRQKPENKICRRCKGKASPHPHHKNGRLGTLLIESSLFVPLCQKCHDWVHKNPGAARRQSFLAPLGGWNHNPFKKGK